MPLFIEAVGVLDGYVNAEIRARVRGYLRTQNYKDGATVKQGDLLFTIEQDEYVAAVASAKAALSRANASKINTTAALDRNQALAPKGVVSKAELDTATANLADSNGQVDSAQAALRQAELNLSYTQIHAPNDGVAGLALVRIGNLVGQDGPTLLTTVSQVDPIRVNFPMSEIDYLKYPERFKRFQERDLAWAQKQFPKLDQPNGRTDDGDAGIELILADNSVYKHRGLIVTANRQVDTTTGTIQLQALFPNSESILRPGQYGRIRIRRQSEGEHVIVVPEKALISVQGAYSVAVVGADKKVAMHRIEVGPASNGYRIVTNGVNEGDTIVVEGTQKVADGQLVNPQPAPLPSAAPMSSAAPAPAAISSAAKP